jgi:hypothetical protein
MIRVHGWALTQVDGGHRIWSYTVGLMESFGHPELLVVQIEFAAQASLIERLVEPIRTTGSLDPVELEQLGVSTAVVHPANLTGELLGDWYRRYDDAPSPGSYLQVFAPDDWFCECHRGTTPRLDVPSRFAQQSSRAERRAEERARRRRRRAA